MELRKLEDVKGSGAPWVMSGMLSGLSVLVAPSKGRKTFVAVSWAVAVASGRPWLGHAVLEGPVAYIVGEGGVVNVANRAREAAREIEASEDLPLYFIPQAVALPDPHQLIELLDTLKEIKPVLVVVDTLSTCMPGDENKQEDMQRFVAACREIQAQFDACVLVLHHTPVSSSSRARGSSVLTGGADTMFLLKNAKESKKGLILELSPTKLKDLATEDFSPSRLVFENRDCRLSNGELLLDNMGCVVSTQVVQEYERDPTRDEKVADAFWALWGTRKAGQAVGVLEWELAAVALGMHRATFYRGLTAILADRPRWAIYQDKPGHYMPEGLVAERPGLAYTTTPAELRRNEWKERLEDQEREQKAIAGGGELQDFD